jgi:hypothetical protein
LFFLSFSLFNFFLLCIFIQFSGTVCIYSWHDFVFLFDLNLSFI